MIYFSLSTISFSTAKKEVYSEFSSRSWEAFHKSRVSSENLVFHGLHTFEWQKGHFNHDCLFCRLNAYVPYLCSMESFPGVASRVIQEFKTLLQHGASLLGSTNILQIITINMFAVHNSQSKGTFFGVYMKTYWYIKPRTDQTGWSLFIFCLLQGSIIKYFSFLNDWRTYSNWVCQGVCLW